jgi:hypothetical protein
VESINRNGRRVVLNPDDSPRTIRMLVADPRIKVLQFAKPLSPGLFEVLNEEFFATRPEVELRAYGFYGEVCDLSFCRLMSNVERFRADCLHDALGIEHICKMARLRLLGIGIWNLESFSFLEDVTDGLQEITLTQTKSKRPDLKPLRRFRSLRKLFLNAQQKDIDVLAGHPSLEDLSLSSIALPSVELVRTLPNLQRLMIMLGGTRNLASLDGMTAIKELELIRISRFTDVSVISSLTGLQHLILRELRRIESLPSLSRLTALRRVTLENLGALMDISGLQRAPALEEIVHISARVAPEDYISILQKDTLRYAFAGFGSKQKNARFREICLASDVTFGVDHRFLLQ